MRCCGSGACVNMSGVKCCDKYGGSVSSLLRLMH